VSLGKRKFLWCKKCQQTRWATLVVGYNYSCTECESDINLADAKRQMKRDRKAARETKAKQYGTYQSKAERKERRRINSRGTPNPQYVLWVKMQRCCVPGCTHTGFVDAHHAIPKSQGGPDESCVPLCHYHHVGVYHGQLGSVERALEVWGVDLLQVAEKLFARFSILQMREKSQDKKNSGSAPDGDTPT